MISESDVELKVTPRARSSECSSTALIRLPLWASASSRRLPPVPVGALHRLRVRPGVGAGRRVADVADRELAAERGDVVLVEDLADEAEVAAGDDRAADVGRGDARGLLPAVLERVQREKGQPGHLVIGRVDPEDAALVARTVAHRRRGARLSSLEAAESSDTVTETRRSGPGGLPERAPA